MEQVIAFFEQLFIAENWPPRWFCGEWSSFHGWLYIFSDIGIWSAYFVIPLLMFYVWTKREGDIPFKRIFWLYILFIMSCGATHLVDAMLFYYPAYRISALALFFCAVVSWATVIGLLKVLPEALKIRSPEKWEELSSNLLYQNEQLQNFADITTHNLRTPVGNLRKLIDLYEEESDPDQQAEYIQEIKSSTNQLEGTLQDLYQVAKMTQTSEKERTTLKFEQVLQDVKKERSTLIKETNAEITFDFSESPRIKYPKSYLYSIVQNLLTNALKYRSPDRPPEVHFKTWGEEDRIIFTCADNGQGLDIEKYGDKAFELHKTFHDNPDARGVGLFVTKSQVNAMGDEIFMESEVGKGSTFTIIFYDKQSL